MREIIFRPLRKIKKTGKITVASYAQWRKIMTADYGKFKLTIIEEYKQFNPDEFVYNHDGKQLFFYDFNPADIPVFEYQTGQTIGHLRKNNPEFGMKMGLSSHVYYSAKGMDCDGVPTFNHFTANYIATHYQDMNEFEPLTVKMVTHWFGWFLYQLNNSNLTA